ncbi:cytochrome P450 [Paraphaeosphaeria sporulosa]|uniref:Cytochrome P450 n=1 Tax=Paraphaeosphaeria sporulosa TaxID=1460663 RepID=A0A177CDF5_9PLEO|nr:cytochrome P450 [Paraphaeosphaeria sporulosa]OAG05261.1 cytochrome P450 [Paraphaeosphaeria sporulosa]
MGLVDGERLWQLAIWTPVAFAVYFVAVAIYRITLHPLAKYPGPLLWRISPIPSIISLLRGRISFDYKVHHDKYGPVVRVMPNELSFNTAKAWEDIYGHRVGMANMDKDPIHVGAVEAIPGATNLTMAPDVHHARQRRALAHAFSKQALLEQEPILKGYVDLFVKRLREMAHKGEAANMVSWFNFCTFDIIGDLSFGEPFGCLQEGEGGESANWVVLVYESIKAGALEQATRRFASPGSLGQRFMMWCIPSIIRERRFKHLRNSTEKTNRRMATKTDHRDFIWYILKQREKKNEVSDDEVIMNAALFIVAGSETTATELCGLTNYLLRNPEKYARIKDELRSACKTEADLNMDVLGSLPYMNACIEEGLRIFPPVPIGLLRTVPKGGSLIDGHMVPENTSVCVASWAAAHSANNFADPDSFIPERFLDTPESKARYGSDIKKAAQPFSLGPRGCIGRNLTYVELRLILGALLWHFDMEFADGAPLWNPKDEFKGLRAYNTWEKSPLKVKLTDIRKTPA